MWWKVYFWIILVMSVLGLVFAYGRMQTWSLASWIEIVGSIILLLGLYAYVYKKKILKPSFWNIFFWFLIFSTVFDIMWAFTPIKTVLPLPSWLSSEVITNGVELLLGVAISIPNYYAIYRLSKN
ncbi:hypothetical protein A3H26_01555 [candidate division WWE3 bacterium RIFCSPLOWO2_12_FULL_36_10]|uniref:Uncharacterized protein n=1 Tax=candidate division WWE3 bacterium RIFCSPLOWO2_12_FULL_36_10 TaxID=1802630 RepID=A0A1F4VGQ4_UNCKA|nr:MAG: hypothetical protein A3H26_01555 [candidate division WWE3 bacterium RIFCSPLOWO2_12_FULL_36_10]